MLALKRTTLFSTSISILSAFFLSLAVFFLTIVPTTAMAEQKLVYGDYEVHYIGLSSDFLTAEVSKQYDIPRSRALGFLNISVLQHSKDIEIPTSVNATITGSIRNLIGQNRELEFRRIQEGKAIYYISTFRFDDGDMYNFDLDVVPSNAPQRHFDVKFSQRFYEDN